MPLIISCLTNSYGRFGAQAAIDLLPSAGVGYVELPIRTAGVPSFFGDEPLVTTESSLDDLDDVLRRLEAQGLKLSSCNITSGNPLDAAVVGTTMRKLDLASHLGVELVVGGAGEVENDGDLPTLYRHLEQIGDRAGELGIVYCFETHPGLCQHHYGMLETMQALDHLHLRLNFDTGNIHYYNEHVNGEIALAKVCHHVRHMHLKDSEGEFGQWNFPALGDGGAVDFVRVLEIMRPLEFHGPYSLEIEGVANEGELPLETYHQRIVDSLEHLRHCGFFDASAGPASGKGSGTNC